jgi:hypothetical protein
MVVQTTSWSGTMLEKSVLPQVPTPQRWNQQRREDHPTPTWSSEDLKSVGIWYFTILDYICRCISSGGWKMSKSQTTHWNGQSCAKFTTSHIVIHMPVHCACWLNNASQDWKISSSHWWFLLLLYLTSLTTSGYMAHCLNFKFGLMSDLKLYLQMSEVRNWWTWVSYYASTVNGM